MIHFLSSELMELFSGFRLLSYVTFRAMGVALTSLLLSLVLGPYVIRILTRLKLGQPIRGREEVHKLADLHGSKKGTPTMGGILILFTVTLSCLLWGDLTNHYLWAVLSAMLALGFLGFLDDFKKITKKKAAGISSRQKLMGQFFVAVCVSVFFLWQRDISAHAFSLQVPFFKQALVENMGWWIALPFLCFVIVGASNGVNLTDGLDGLAIGCTIPVTAVYAIFAYVTSNAKAAEHLLIPYVPGTEELVVFCSALGGAALGFLWFNCYPAKVFMGDTGSLAIGGAIAVVAIAVNQELLLVIVGGIFVMEAMSVILQVASFKLTGKRIFAMAPIHHHFELKGWSETTVVVRFWILAMVFALIGLATLKLR